MGRRSDIMGYNPGYWDEPEYNGANAIHPFYSNSFNLSTF